MNETTDAATILGPLWRGKWLILIVGVVVAALTYVYYHRQHDVYAAKTQLYLGGAAEQQGVLNSTLGKASPSPTQVADQAALVNSTIAETVRHKLLAEHKPVLARGKVRAKASAGSDFVEIDAEAASPLTAVRLANLYAQTYVAQHEAGYQRAIRAAIGTTRHQLRRIEASQQAAAAAPKGRGASRDAGVSGVATLQGATLSARINQLESDLSVSSVRQVSPAKAGDAQLVSSSPKRNALFGFVIGLALAAVAAFAADRLDRRLRSLAEVEDVFRTPVLAALPRVRAPIVQRDGQPQPADALLEPLRGLHTALALGDMLVPEHGSAPRRILFLSADAGDGKSTLAAELALVQRDAGARVAVIEADMRRPTLANLLALSSPRGLAEVLTGAVTFAGALQNVGGLVPDIAYDAEAPAAPGGPGTAVSTIAQTRPLTTRATGSLVALPGGGPAANPPALLAGAAMQELLGAATADFDYVLIDAPPLQVSDAMPLLRMVDGIVIVGRLEHTRTASAERLTQLLSRSSTAPVLGVVANGASLREIRRHGFPSAYSDQH
ncbi:MAG TPA: Wzz/FepE/Etk N-terminal domain-containing protein [Solirubrobacteraceae bacterium]|jgi:succinoglycan biosynthesis transport protein ExoP|nr:Wzz/FepE/Etk N-terminal domain-containing protein [Solirubrobacteraceae bacterium]